jgi:putative transposase
LSKIMGIFHKRYSDYYNQKYHHVGHVFQQRFNSSPKLYPDDLLYVSRYIHRNPINTKIPLVEKMEDYPYSSYQYYKKSTPPPYDFINVTDLPLCFRDPSEQNFLHYCEYVEREDEPDNSEQNGNKLDGAWHL